MTNPIDPRELHERMVAMGTKYEMTVAQLVIAYNFLVDPANYDDFSQGDCPCPLPGGPLPANQRKASEADPLWRNLQLWGSKIYGQKQRAPITSPNWNWDAIWLLAATSCTNPQPRGGCRPAPLASPLDPETFLYPARAPRPAHAPAGDGWNDHPLAP